MNEIKIEYIDGKLIRKPSTATVKNVPNNNNTKDVDVQQMFRNLCAELMRDPTVELEPLIKWIKKFPKKQ